MTRSESIANIADALSKAQGAIKGAVKDSKNPHFGSSYADLASVWDACTEVLPANHIAVVQSPSADGNLVRMSTLLLHASGEWIESDPLQVQARDAGPQAVGSCLTYLRRYQLAAVVGVAPEDDDGEAAEGRANNGRGKPAFVRRDTVPTPKGEQAIPASWKPLAVPEGVDPRTGEVKEIPQAEATIPKMQTGAVRVSVTDASGTVGLPTNIKRLLQVTETDMAINEAQQRRLFQIAKKAGWRPDEIRKLFKQQYGIEESAQIPESAYPGIIEVLELGTETVF